MSSFWMPNKKPLYAPMLASFGGGSSRGYGRGGRFGGVSGISGLAGTASPFTSANIRTTGVGWEPPNSYRTAALTLGWEQSLGGSGYDFNFVWSDTQSALNNPVYTGTISGDGSGPPSVSYSTNSIYTTSHNEPDGGARDIAWFRDGSGFIRTSWAFSNKIMKYNATVPMDGTFPGSNTSVSGSAIIWDGGVVTENGTWGISQYDEIRDRIYFGSSTSNSFLYYINNWSSVTSSTSSITPVKIDMDGIVTNIFYGVEYDPWADVIYIYGSDYIDVWNPSDLSLSGRIGSFSATGFNIDLLIVTRYYILGGESGWASRY